MLSINKCKKEIGLHITTDHTGKMSDMQSLSTTCKVNPFCPDRIARGQEILQEKKRLEKIAKKYYRMANLKKNAKYKNDLMDLYNNFKTQADQIKVPICAFCFSNNMQDYMTGMEKPLAQNYKILSEIIPLEKLPQINAIYFRFEAFGDLGNVNQVINYFNIAKYNRNTKFALWTKNPQFIQEALNMGYKKPKNLVIVLSSYFINSQDDFSRFDFVDKIFTVYEKDYAKENKININCGARNCFTCHRCYTKSTSKIVNEIRK